MEMQHTFRITNGDQVKRTFSDAEMQSRLDKLRAMMACTMFTTTVIFSTVLLVVLMA